MKPTTTAMHTNQIPNNVQPDSNANINQEEEVSVDSTMNLFDIQLSHVSASYENRRTGKTDVLHDISFTVHAGRRLVIMGENGSGKTTLLRVLAGLLSYNGSILYGEDELHRLSPSEKAAKVSLMSQISKSYYPYTVRETVMLGRYLKMKRLRKNTFISAIVAAFASAILTARAEDEEAVTELLSEMNLADIADRRIDTLSGGQLQRVFLARAYAQDTPVLLLDEPSNHLDLRYQDELADRLLQEKKHRTIIGIFHDLYMARTLAEDIALLKDGRLLKVGTADEILADTALLSTTFGTDITKRLDLQRCDNRLT